VDHYDVFGHGVCTFSVRSRCCPPENQRRNSKTKRRLKKFRRKSGITLSPKLCGSL